MAERSIRAILRAEVGQYTAAMGEAAEEIEKNLDLLRREATPNSQSNSYSYE